MNITRLRPLRAAPASFLAGQPIASEPYAVSPEASALLAEVLARLPGVSLPIVQLLPAGRAQCGSQLARAFAAASVARFGRTLLFDAGAKTSVSGRSLVSRSAGRRQRRAPEVTPDVDIAGLYHRGASGASMDAIVAETPGAQPFNMIVVNSAALGACSTGLDRARQCHGSILMVAAGINKLSEVQASARQLHHAGGTLLGAVLFDVPRLALW